MLKQVDVSEDVCASPGGKNFVSSALNPMKGPVDISVKDLVNETFHWTVGGFSAELTKLILPGDAQATHLRHRITLMLLKSIIGWCVIVCVCELLVIVILMIVFNSVFCCAISMICHVKRFETQKALYKYPY